MRTAACGLAGLTLFLCSCASVIGLEEGVLDEVVVIDSTDCPTGKGPDMIRVPGPGGIDYCIDRTEVTAAQYDGWLKLDPDLADQPAVCSSNSDFTPSNTMIYYCNNYKYPEAVADDSSSPVRCADWCDAVAFCKWAGKRLCGKIGAGTNKQSAAIDPDSSQWYRACSQAGAKQLPYGDVFNKKACVGADYEPPDEFQPVTDYPHDVGAAEGCTGGYPGLVDMSGNLREWEDSCNVTVGKDDKCYARGGSYKDSIAALSCTAVSEHTRGEGEIDVGFRCCADVN